ncbi:hypothetical protein C1925_04940 [Stenotrophomonas sp. SAU14A_NAIMI4_5]|uniref:hypothetical protein n=1 Tax=Stenotrophomonas sp. SAU14A_NAIMI4_5 TaxID=2072413 RepID=UPI000D540DCD|nr:hypothetical protein [Stenotrophomonas sp. SAU14A_NAIMI4_5]AWH48550.1 hypothetical protein C1925_04940 [Stenotrophomonas sp. SAU14A_NAIMI4_5]
MGDDRLDKLLSLAEKQHATIVEQGKQIAELGMHVGLLVQAVAQLLGEEAGVPVQDEGTEPPRLDLDGNPY